MHLVIDHFGAFLGKRENRFRLVMDKEETEYSADDVEQILIQSPCSLSADAIRLATEKTIDIVFLDWRGEPYARVFPCRLGGTTLTRRKQAEAAVDSHGGVLARAFVKAKVSNQYFLLRALLKERPAAGLLLPKLRDGLRQVEHRSGTCDELRQSLLGAEGNAASQYFRVLSRILPFPGRDQNAADPVNIALNYGYGILYSEIERACILAGLDPFFGYLHTDRYGKPSMVLDLIEAYRPVIVDRTIITLVVQKQLSDGDIEGSGASMLLTKDARRKIADAVLKRLHTEVQYRGKRRKFQEIIAEDARNIVRYLLGQNEAYEPFVYRW